MAATTDIHTSLLHPIWTFIADASQVAKVCVYSLLTDISNPLRQKAPERISLLACGQLVHPRQSILVAQKNLFLFLQFSRSLLLSRRYQYWSSGPHRHTSRGRRGLGHRHRVSTASDPDQNRRWLRHGVREVLISLHFLSPNNEDSYFDASIYTLHWTIVRCRTTTSVHQWHQPHNLLPQAPSDIRLSMWNNYQWIKCSVMEWIP